MLISKMLGIEGELLKSLAYFFLCCIDIIILHEESRSQGQKVYELGRLPRKTIFQFLTRVSNEVKMFIR